MVNNEVYERHKLDSSFELITAYCKWEAAKGPSRSSSQAATSMKQCC